MALAKYIDRLSQLIAGHVLTVILGAALMTASAMIGHAADLVTECSADNEVEPRTVTCGFRVNEPVQPEALKLLANGEALDATFTSFSKAGQKSAWLFLIDTSNPKRAGTVAANADLVASQLRIANENRQMGVATFASEMRSVFPIASTHADIDGRLKQIKADGVATEFFANSLEAIKLLKQVDADRKALVIFSDGKAEDTAYTLSDVSKAANEADVVIFGLGYAESEGDRPSLQPIKRLAEETNGHFVATVSGQQLSADLASNLTRYLENGGYISAPLIEMVGEVDLDLEVTLPGGRVLNASQSVSVAELPDESEPEPEPLSLIAKVYSAFDRVFSGASQWANANQMLAWICLLVPLLAIVAAIAALTMRGGRPEDILDDQTPETGVLNTEFDLQEGGATRAISTPVGQFGYFEIVGSEETRFPIESHSISIGRHSDNDFQLANDSVHRHHAHLHVSADGQATLHDLDTVNGILVNGQKVDKIDLKSGDLIELGEVRIRYQMI